MKKSKSIQQKTGDFRSAALEYHRKAPSGKLAIHPTKPLSNQYDLALAYSPGVAAACEEIVRDPAQASLLTAKRNLVAVISNGTAVLGLGPIGPLASKPVMEGKAVLFKKFSGIDVFDLEINETDPDKLVDIIASLEPTFGAINLEDIKSPECFIVERKLRERLSIPVLHDDQHGTAIIVGAAITNGLRLVDKEISEIKLVTSGAGAAALACLDLLVALLLQHGDVDAMLCGTVGPFINHLTHVRDIVGKREDVRDFSSVTVLVLPEGTFFLCDTHVIPSPSVDEIVAMTLLAAEAVQRFGIKPRIALVSHSNFGSRNNTSSEKMRKAVKILQEMEPQLVVEGEMHADAAISETIRTNVFPDSKLRGRANTLILPNIDAANISYNLLKMLGGGVTVGPMLAGAAKPAHILTNASTVHGIVNMSALAVVEAQSRTRA